MMTDTTNISLFRELTADKIFSLVLVYFVFKLVLFSSFNQVPYGFLFSLRNLFSHFLTRFPINVTHTISHHHNHAYATAIVLPMSAAKLLILPSTIVVLFNGVAS